MSKDIRIMIADDREYNRLAYRRLFEDVEGIKIVGEVSVIGNLLKMTRELSPNVILLDLKWGNSEYAGLHVLQKIRKENLAVRVILLTAHPELLHDYPLDMASADRVLLSGTSREAILADIRSLYSQSLVSSRAISLEKISPVDRIWLGLFCSLFVLIVLLFLLALISDIQIMKTVVSYSMVCFGTLVLVYFVYIRRVSPGEALEFVKLMFESLKSRLGS